MPAGIEVRIGYDESKFVERAIEEVWLTLGIAFVLVVLVIFVFLRNLRSTIIPAVAIPVSIVGTFAVLYFMGYSVNILTMLALVLAIGVVVDDAIVVLENIYRHIEQGEPPMQAAFKGMEEIGFAIIAITLSLVAVFMPLAFQKTTTGRLFIEFAFAMAGSVVISAFVALSLSPMMAARILRPVEREKHGPLFNFFERGLRGDGPDLRPAARVRAGASRPDPRRGGGRARPDGRRLTGRWRRSSCRRRTRGACSRSCSRRKVRPASTRTGCCARWKVSSRRCRRPRPTRRSWRRRSAGRARRTWAWRSCRSRTSASGATRRSWTARAVCG